MPRLTSSLFTFVVSAAISFSSVGFWGGTTEAATRVAEGDCPLISQSQAARHGLQRQWHTQVVLDSSNNRVTHLTLVPKSETSPDTLFVQTERSTVFAIDAETGKTLWSRLVGQPDLVSDAIGCNDQMVAVLNGSTLYILNRLNGRIMWARSFPGVPAAGPVLSKRYAYVPLLDGCVAAHPIRKIENPDEKISRFEPEDSESGAEGAQAASAKMSSASTLTLSQKDIEPLVCPSMYRIETQPVLIQDDVVADRLAWINRDGMYVGAISNKGTLGFTVDYALATSLAFESSPAFVPSRFTHPDATKREKAPGDESPFENGESIKDVPIFGALLVASTDGHVNAIQAGSGGTLWGYQVGQPIVNPIVAIGARAYVVSEFGQMLCLDARTGKKLWETRDVSQFVAQTPDRIYVLDSSGERLSALRVADGRRLDKFPVSGFTRIVSNDKTDRLFLATETGLIQSLRQRGVDEPLRHQE